MEFLGIKWVGINPENGQKLFLSIVFIAVVLLLGKLARWVSRRIIDRSDAAAVQRAFWTRQAINLLVAVVMILGLLSIWFNDPTRLSTAFGLVTAGLAFALQQVVTSLAGYFVILRGATFTIGDRISMGGVRGDVLQLGFIQTTIMEMGQPPPVQGADPAMWVKSRQFTGRIVTVSNSKIFSEPVFNYTRDFPFIWEEMTLPIAYKDDHKKVERILIEAATRHGEDPNAVAADAKAELQRRFSIEQMDLEPRVFYRITDNWLELTVRFIVGTHRIRGAKDAMSRFIVDELDAAGIGIASATYEIVGLPSIELRRERHDGSRAAPATPASRPADAPGPAPQP